MTEITVDISRSNNNCLFKLQSKFLPKKQTNKLQTENKILEPVRCFSGENHYLKQYINEQN